VNCSVLPKRYKLGRLISHTASHPEVLEEYLLASAPRAAYDSPMPVFRTAFILVVAALLAGCATAKKEEPPKPLTPQEIQAQKISELRQATISAPNDPQAQYALGNALFDAGRFVEAKNAYQSAITLKPDYAAAYCNLGLCLRVLGQADDAISAYQRALEIEPNDETTLKNLIEALRGKGDVESSIRYLTQLTELRPDDVLVRSELANLYFLGNDFEAAELAFQEVIRLDPGMSSDYYNLGLCQMQQEKFDTALTTWLTALAYDANNASVRKGLAVLHWRRGDYDSAWKAVVDCQTRNIPLDNEFLSALRNDSGQIGPAAE